MKIPPELEDFLNTPHEFEPFLDPNGSIKIPLENRYELLIWSSSIPKPKYNVRIHNHKWVQASRVIYGTLWHIHYSQKPYADVTHELYDFDTLEPSGTQMALRRCEPWKLNKGDLLCTIAGQFHYMWNDGPACSLIVKNNTRPAMFEPKIATRIGTVPERSPVKGLHSSAIPLIVENAYERIIKTLGDNNGSK